MSLNENQINGKWLEIKGEVQKAWGKLTDDELEKTKGDMKAIGGLIQQKYGHAETKYEGQLNEIVHRFEDQKSSKMDQAKESLKK